MTSICYNQDTHCQRILYLRLQKEGQNEIHITSIPSCVDTDSARITGLGDAILFDVICTVPEGRGLFARPASSPAIAALERKRAVLQGERNLQGHAADILVRYGQRLSTEKDHGGLEVDTFLDGMLKRGSAALKETEELDAKIAELDGVIENERKKERGRPQLTGSVTAVIMANKQGSVEITLTYSMSSV